MALILHSFDCWAALLIRSLLSDAVTLAWPVPATRSSSVCLCARCLVWWQTQRHRLFVWSNVHCCSHISYSFYGSSSALHCFLRNIGGTRPATSSNKPAWRRIRSRSFISLQSVDCSIRLKYVLYYIWYGVLLTTSRALLTELFVECTTCHVVGCHQWIDYIRSVIHSEIRGKQ